MDVTKYLSYGMVFHQQIRRAKEAANDKNWEWENCLPDPMTAEECELVMAIAGCWSKPNPKNGCTKFFTDQRHPFWAELHQPYV
ncbi:MAG: hypothetical protein IJL20_12560 [Lachnospiraceae bacterium]|nr:hypothetical protein [Lachnospiraceae bacterium]